MENQPTGSSLKTPSKSKWGLWIHLMAGASLILFVVYFVFDLVSLFSGKFDGSSLIPLLVLLAPIVFCIILLIKGDHTRKGATFGFDVAGIAIWLVAIVVIFLAIGLAGLFTAIVSCPISSSSSSSIASSLSSSSASSGAPSGSQTCNSWAVAFLNLYTPLSLIFIVSAIVHEVFLGLNAFGKKKLPIPLYIFTGLMIIASLALGLDLTLNLGANKGYYLLPFLATDFLTIAFDFVILYGDNEKVSPHPEDTLENQEKAIR
jgi:hypothetical protein